ncbi:unnamed protein product [Caretta caretta]
MSAINSTDIGSHLFILMGIPGLEAAHIWISVPLCSMYIVSLLGKTGVLVVVLVERSLQQPVYLFLSILATSDLILSSTTVPEILLMLWFKAGEIAACLTQMFFVHAVFALESAILLAMAFDRLSPVYHVIFQQHQRGSFHIHPDGHPAAGSCSPLAFPPFLFYLHQITCRKLHVSVCHKTQLQACMSPCGLFPFYAGCQRPGFVSVHDANSAAYILV